MTPRLEELQLFALQQEFQSADPKQNEIKRTVREKRKANTDITEEESPAKKKSTKRPKNEGAKPVENAAKLDNKQGNEKTNEEDKVIEVNMKVSRIDKPRVFTDQCTAFISNLDLKVSVYIKLL